MGAFFAYIIKAAVVLTVLYLFHTLLLSRETFHRFNRMVLLGILLASFVIPAASWRSHAEGDIGVGQWTAEIVVAEATGSTAAHHPSLLPWVLMAIYTGGVAVLLLREAASYISLLHLIRTGRKEDIHRYVATDVHATLVVHRRKLLPFSWGRYIVLSQDDVDGSMQEILIHELAHISKHHSADLMIADLCIMLQWFNPAAWLLKRELQSIHEYQADEAVINHGIDATQYQLLLIRKAVGTRLYSMANSFNHSKLKRRITMMLKKKSNPWGQLKYLYVLPAVAIAVATFALPQVASATHKISAVKVNDLAEIVKTMQQENTGTALNDTVQKSTVMPSFPDGGLSGPMAFLTNNVRYPAQAKEKGIEGTVVTQFTIDKEGHVVDPTIIRSVDKELDDEALRVIKGMPRWTPGMINGEPADMKMTMPVAFLLKGKETTDTANGMTSVALHQDGSDTKVSHPVVVAHRTDGGQQAGGEGPRVIVEKMPQFPGGMTGLVDFLSQNISYPKEYKGDAAGKVIVQFVVSKDGSVINPQVIRSVDEALDAEALRVVKLMPKWTPGMSQGKPVDVQYVIPITFQTK